MAGIEYIRKKMLTKKYAHLLSTMGTITKRYTAHGTYQITTGMTRQIRKHIENEKLL